MRVFVVDSLSNLLNEVKEPTPFVIKDSNCHDLLSTLKRASAVHSIFQDKLLISAVAQDLKWPLQPADRPPKVSAGDCIIWAIRQAQSTSADSPHTLSDSVPLGYRHISILR